jgi:hypothetical protein
LTTAEIAYSWACQCQYLMIFSEGRGRIGTSQTRLFLETSNRFTQSLRSNTDVFAERLRLGVRFRLAQIIKPKTLVEDEPCSSVFEDGNSFTTPNGASLPKRRCAYLLAVTIFCRNSVTIFRVLASWMSNSFIDWFNERWLPLICGSHLLSVR